MKLNLTSRMLKALKILSFECDYEDSRHRGTDVYILRSKIGPGVGDKTLSELEDMGLISSGQNQYFDEKGYRITDLGREAIQTKPSRKASTPRKQLKPLQSRLRKPKGRLDK